MTRPESSRSFWRGRPVYVTGGTGLMGGWLVNALVDLGAEVILLVRDRTPASFVLLRKVLDRVTMVEGSLSDPHNIRRALSEYSVDTIFHLAAQPLVGVAKMDPVGTLETNIKGTWNILDAARQVGIPHVVVASSDKAYGPSDKLPYREDDPLRGEHPYDASKSCVDILSRMYAKAYGMRVGITRCGNLYGGGDFNFSRTVPGLIRSTYRREPFVVRSDGKFVRDYLYVKDAANAYLTLAECLAADASLSGEAFNFSASARLTVLDLIRTVLDLMGCNDLEPVIQNTASSEIREQYLDSGKARQMLGWTPSYTVEESLRETIDWYVSFFDGRPV